jgi:hypothetical protein
MQPIAISTVRSKKDRAIFVRLPCKFYRNDPHWVPPLIGEQMAFINPPKGVFFDHGESDLFPACRSDEPVRRIRAHINKRYNQYFAYGKGFAGFFEYENSEETAPAVFGATGSNKVMINSAERMPVERYRTWRIYRKDLAV